MPDLTGQTAIFRRGGYTYTGYISVVPQTVVLAGTITAVPTYPAKTLSYTLTSGDEDDALGDLTVNFYSSGGTKKATLRIATGTASTNTVLQVAEFAQGVYDVASGDTFQVIKAWNIWDRLVSATAALNKDSRIAYSDQNANPQPIANSGGAVAGFDTSLSFYGSTSYTIDPDSSGTLSHSWIFQDATPSSSAVANPTGIVFPVGFRWVEHSVSDSSNSKISVQYVPVWVHDNSTYPALAVQMDSLSGNVEQGWRCSFKLPRGSEADIADLPDGSMVVYWEKEVFNGTVASYGSNVANRSHVKFVGYLVSDSIHVDPDTSEISFEAVSPLEILSQTPALPQLMVANSAPTKWSEIRGLTTKMMFVYLARWHASIMNAFDFVYTDALSIAYLRVAVEGDSIAAQLRDIAQGLNCQVTCDRLGRIIFSQDPDFLAEGDRPGRTTTYDLTTADIMELDIPRNHRGTVKFARGEGITQLSKPVFSNSPGNAPAPYGTGSDTLSRQIVTDQDDLNTRTGLYFAKVNNLYNGQFVPAGVRVKLPDGYDIFDPAYREFVTLDLPASYNSRAVGFEDTERWTCEGVDISYDIEAGTKDINVTIDHETLGVPGVTYHMPPEETNGLPPLADPPPLEVTFPEIGTDPISGTLPSGGGVVASNKKAFAVFGTDNQLSITSDFSKTEASGGPDWDTLIDLTGLANWGGGNLIQFEADPFSPAYLTTASTAVNGWFITNTHVQYIEDIFGTPALHAATALHDDSEHRTLAVSRKTRQVAYIATWYETEGVFAAVTVDYDTWTEAVVTSDELTTSVSAPGLWVSPKTAGSARIAVWTTTDDVGMDIDAVAQVYKTTNTGTSWTLLTVPDVELGQDVSSTLVTPFQNTGSYVYHRKNDVVDGVTLTRNAGGVEADITPNVSGTTLIPQGLYAREFAVPDQDQNTMVMVGVTGGSCAENWDLVDGSHGTILDRTPTTITIEASETIPGGWYIILTINGSLSTPSTDLCTNISSIVGDPVPVTESWVNCGEDYPANLNTGLFGSDKCIWYYQAQALAPFTVTITFTSTDGCGDCVPAEIYGVVLSKNIRAAESLVEWTSLAMGDDVEYRQVIAMSGKQFLVYGINMSIGVANKTEIDSRRGNLVSAGRCVGACGAG